VDGGKPRAAVGEFGDLTFDVERHDGDLADKCHCCSQRDLFLDGAATAAGADVHDDERDAKKEHRARKVISGSSDRETGQSAS
jgi:hypothetical protein